MLHCYVFLLNLKYFFAEFFVSLWGYWKVYQKIMIFQREGISIQSTLVSVSLSELAPPTPFYLDPGVGAHSLAGEGVGSYSTRL